MGFFDNMPKALFKENEEGTTVTVHERPVSVPGWNGTGYNNF